MERAYILETFSVLTPESFPSELFESEAHLPSISIDAHLTLAEVRHRGIGDIETRYLEELLAHNKGKIKDSAQEAGMTTRQLHKLMKKHSIRKEGFKDLA